MSHLYRSHFYHVIWAIKKETCVIDHETRVRLQDYLCSVAKNYSGKILQVRVEKDHVHVLIEVKKADYFTPLVRYMKAYSALWIHKTFEHCKNFSWQEGYISFTVSYSLIQQVRDYVIAQEHQHKTLSYEEEVKILLEQHGIELGAA